MLVCCDKTLLSPFHSEVSIPGGMLLETEMLSPLDQLRQRWENLNKDQSTKLQLSLNTLEQDQLSPVQVHLFLCLQCNKLCNLTFAVSQSLCLSLLLSHTITHICPSYVSFRVQVVHRSRLSSPSMVFRGESGSQDAHSPRALFEACSQTLERIAQEVTPSFSSLFVDFLAIPCLQLQKTSY